MMVFFKPPITLQQRKALVHVYEMTKAGELMNSRFPDDSSNPKPGAFGGTASMHRPIARELRSAGYLEIVDSFGSPDQSKHGLTETGRELLMGICRDCHNWTGVKCTKTKTVCRPTIEPDPESKSK